MKQTMPLADFAAEVDRQRTAMQDFLIPEYRITVNPTGELLLPTNSNPLAFGTRDVFESQFARELGYPAQFFQYTKTAHPEQWATLVNAMLENRPSDRVRMVRTLDGNARAYLSNSYSRIDNWQIAETILKAAQRHGGKWEVVGTQVTENRMYIKVMTDWSRDIVPGKKVRAGFIVTNSELGDQSVSVRMIIEMEWCTNGAIRELAARVRHASRAYLPAFTNGAYELSANVQRAGESFLMAQVNEMVEQTVNEKHFTSFVEDFRASTHDTIPHEVPIKNVIDVTAKELGIRETETNSILRYLAEGGELNRFGVIDAVTLAAQHVDSYDYSVALEEAGGRLIEMSPAKWDGILRTARNDATKSSRN
jgi:hypothetical protein